MSQIKTKPFTAASLIIVNNMRHLRYGISYIFFQSSTSSSTYISILYSFPLLFDIASELRSPSLSLINVPPTRQKYHHPPRKRHNRHLGSSRSISRFHTTYTDCFITSRTGKASHNDTKMEASPAHLQTSTARSTKYESARNRCRPFPAC